MMELNVLSSGSEAIDSLLCGGYEKDVITTIYGPAGCGKTTFCLLACVSALNSGKKAIFIDTEGGFSPIRFRQIAGAEKLKSIFVLKPVNFDEQKRDIEKLKTMINDSVGLVVVDTISMLYRLRKEAYNELGLQISYLAEITRTRNIPVLVTTQVYADFEVKEGVKMVGGDILKYSSKCIIEIVKLRTKRKAVIIKHRHLPENKEIMFEIKEKGLI